MRVNRLAARSTFFYLAVGLALLALVLRAQYLFVSEGLGARIGHNSEALGLALLICFLVQYVRPWANQPFRASRVIGVFGALMAIYLVLHFAVSTTTVSTLDECFSGAAYVWLYMMIPSRFRSAPAAILIILSVIVVFFDTTFVLEQAESLVPLLIAPLALDVMDKTILEPDLPDRRMLRLAWIVLLAVIGLSFMVAATWARGDLQGAVKYTIDYGQRASEAYWAWILIHLYFGYVVPPRLRGGSRRREDAAASM